MEACRDLEEELGARLDLMSRAELAWQPHVDANSAAVTAWHVARWLDVLGTRVFTGGGADQDLWHTAGWRERTGYEPDGIGYLGLGTLTGYTAEEMRAVPVMAAEDLRTYLAQATTRLIEQIRALGEAVRDVIPGLGLSPYQLIGSTLQGSFGHVGEIDTLVALRERLGS